ncbi:MAG: amidohydrolase family protein [bacterium]
MKKLVYNDESFYFECNGELFDVVALNDEIIEIPYYYNIHSHLGENIYKDISGDDWTIQKYLNHTFSVCDSMTKEELSIKTAESFNQVIEASKENLIAGICASRSAEVCEKYKFNNLAGYPIMKVERRSEYLNSGIDGFLNYKKQYESDNCIVGISIHALYSNTAKELEFARQCVEHGAGFVTIHISEDLETRAQEIEMYNAKPLKTLENFGLLSDKTIIVHCGHLDQDDFELAKKYNVTVVLCPISNVFLNTRIVDVYTLDELGINWCIATDGLATGRSFSMEEQSLLVKKIFKEITFEELYKRCTISPMKFFDGLTSVRETIKIKVSCNSKEELFENIIRKNYVVV